MHLHLINSKILEIRIWSSSKVIPQKNHSSIFKLNPKRFRNFKHFCTKYFQVICMPSLDTTADLSQNHFKSLKLKKCTALTLLICSWMPTLQPLTSLAKVCLPTETSGQDQSLSYIQASLTSVEELEELNSGVPRLLTPPRPGPCLNFGLQFTLSQPGGQTMGLVWLKFAVSPLELI
jgi:hypothetical protein